MPPKWFLEDRRGGRGGHAKGRARLHPKFRPRLRTEATNGPPCVWPQDRSSRNMDLTPLCPACPPSPFKTRGPWPSSQAANSPPISTELSQLTSPAPRGESAVVLTMSSVCAQIQTPRAQQLTPPLGTCALDLALAGSSPNLLYSAQVCLFRTLGRSPVWAPKSVSGLVEEWILFPESR